MLTFADNAWNVIASFVIFVAGLSIAFGQRKIFYIPHNQAIALYLWHSFFCLFYFWYSLSNIADSTSYYLNSQTYNSGFSLGGSGIEYLISPFTQVLNFTYGNVFLLFNIIGYIGLLALASSFRSVTTYSRPSVKRIGILILFLPGLSFWSAAIGKDAITFMAAALATWSALNIKRRSYVLCACALLFLLARPHMAGILVLSFVAAIIWASEVRLLKKVVLLAISVPASIIAIQFGLSYAGLSNPTDVVSVEEYFRTRQSANLGGGSSVDIASMSIPQRMFTYLFRPLLFDASGVLGLAVSVENLILLLMVLHTLLRRKRTHSMLSRFEVTFFTVFITISWFVLSNTTANLGIAIRQKNMFLPMLYVLLLSYWHRLPMPRMHKVGE